MKLKPIEPCGLNIKYHEPNDPRHICGEVQVCYECLREDRDRYKELFELAMDYIDGDERPIAEQSQANRWFKLRDKFLSEESLPKSEC